MIASVAGRARPRPASTRRAVRPKCHRQFSGWPRRSRRRRHTAAASCERADRHHYGILGAAFKPDSDDIRDSPALAVAARLGQLGARVSVFDPAAMDRARQAHPELSYAGSVQGAAQDADLVLLLTEWPELCDTDPRCSAIPWPSGWIIDARNSLDAQRWRAAGWQYRALGHG